MYSTCIFCGSALGRNESIEHFPVGRQLAFDAEKGRLWFVCESCSRWNLTPLEERWEAVEECERSFRGTTIRTSTENIGMAKLPDGTELVRIGRPLRPEFAGWRYGGKLAARRHGGEFGGRQKRATISGVALAGAAAGFLVFGPPSLLIGLPALAAAELLKLALPDREAGAPLARGRGAGRHRRRAPPRIPVEEKLDDLPSEHQPYQRRSSRPEKDRPHAESAEFAECASPDNSA
jgi:hypothetical protein